jgi:hypothetical protein
LTGGLKIPVSLAEDGARPGIGDAPPDYRLPFVFAPSDSAISSRTTAAIRLASLDDKNFNSMGTRPLLSPAGLPWKVKEEQRQP